MVIVGVLLVVLWKSLGKRAQPRPPGSGVLIAGSYIAAWIALFFVGFGVGFPLRTGGINSVSGESPAGTFADIYLFPAGFLAPIVPSIGPSLPVVAVALGVVAAQARGNDRPLWLAKGAAIALLVIPFPIAAGLSGEGSGGRGIGLHRAPGEPVGLSQRAAAPTGPLASRDFSPLVA